MEDATGGLLDDICREFDYNYALTCVGYAILILIIWQFIKINFVLPAKEGLITSPSSVLSGLNASAIIDGLGDDVADTSLLSETVLGGASGRYSKGADIKLKPTNGEEFGQTDPNMVKESIWGTAANWGDAETYPTTQPKTSTLGYNYANHVDLYGNTSNYNLTSSAADFAGDAEFSGATSQVIDRAGRDGYAGGRGLSHKEGLDNPDGDFDGDFSAYDIYGTRTNTPAQPLTASQKAGRALSDKTYDVKHGPTYGMYADMPVVLYNTADTLTADEWGLSADKIYRFNSYTWNEDKNY